MSINYQNIFEKGVLINISVRNWEGKVKLTKEQMKDFPTEIVRGVFDLFADKEQTLLHRIMLHSEETRGMVRKMAVPFPVAGIFFIYEKDITRVLEVLKARQIERDSLIEEFLSQYSEGKERFKDKYPEYYEAAVRRGKYLPENELRQKFGFDYKLFQISTPNGEYLKTVSPEIFQEEINKFKNEIEGMKKEVINIVCNELLAKAESLKKQSLGDGKPNQKTFNSLNEFFDTISNLYSDFVERKDVLKAVDKFKKAVGTTTAEDLRFDEGFKAKFGEKIEGIIKTIKVLPDVKVKRAIEF